MNKAVIKSHLASDMMAAGCLALLACAAIFRSGALLPEARRWLAIASLVVTVGWLVLASFRPTPAADDATTRPAETVKHPRLNLRSPTAQLVPLAVLGLFALLSSLWSLDATSSLWSGATLVAGIAYLRSGQVLGQARVGRWPVVPVALACFGSLVSLISLVAFWERSDQWAQFIEGRLNLLGPFGYANAMAGFLILTLPATFAICAQALTPVTRRIEAGHQARGDRRSWVMATVSLAGMFLQGLALYLTRSLGAALALAVAIVLLLGVRLIAKIATRVAEGSPRRGLGIGAAAVGLVATLVAVLSTHRGWVDLVWNHGLSDSHRVQTWQAAVETAKLRPIAGWGSDSFFLAYQPQHTTSVTRFAHNLILQQWVELGLIGLVLLAAVLAVILVAPAARAQRQPLTHWQSLLCWSILAFVLQNLVDLSWYFPALFYLLLIISGSVWSTAASVPGRPSASNAMMP
jgi:O-antigen ligase